MRKGSSKPLKIDLKRIEWLNAQLIDLERRERGQARKARNKKSQE